MTGRPRMKIMKGILLIGDVDDRLVMGVVMRMRRGVRDGDPLKEIP